MTETFNKGNRHIHVYRDGNCIKNAFPCLLCLKERTWSYESKFFLVLVNLFFEAGVSVQENKEESRKVVFPMKIAEIHYLLLIIIIFCSKSYITKSTYEHVSSIELLTK